MCFPEVDDPTDRMAAEERARQAQVAATTARIRELMGAPERQEAYDQHRQHVQEYNMDRHQREATDANRNLRFTLARRGLTGGSAHTDAQGRLDRNVSDQAMAIGQHADAAANRLRAADQRTQSQLISQAQTGLDATTAAQRALENMQVNLAEANQDVQYAGMGGLMSDIALAQAGDLEAQGRALARRPTPKVGAPSSYRGTTTSIG